MKKLFRSYQMPLELLGGVLCLLAVFPSASASGEQLVPPAQESEVVADQAQHLGIEAKSQKWTVPCEREDGSRGIFLVSSNVPEYNSPQDQEKKVEIEKVEVTQQPPAPNINNAPPPVSEPEDPFGYPTLKCGKLLTLLAIFAVTESQR